MAHQTISAQITAATQLRAQASAIGSPRHDWERLETFARELQRWSGRMSLISAADQGHLVERHIVPSLAAIPLLQAVCHRTIIDFGSGAGLPGIPLAVSLPASHFYLVESRRRRVSFLRHVARTLNLRNVTVAHARIDDWAGPTRPADGLITRAARTDDAMPTELQRFLAPHAMVIHYVDSRSEHRAGDGFLWRGHPMDRHQAMLECNLPT
jgi:16S rRNA (guanine527-N7)-methyltransferase